MKLWYVDGETGEAIVDAKDDKELLRVYDYMHLVNLSKNDLLKLHENKILFTDEWRHEGQRYTNVVRVCVEKGLHDGCKLNK